MLATLDKKFPDGSPITVDDNAFCTYTLEGGAVGTLARGLDKLRTGEQLYKALLHGRRHPHV